MEVLSSPIQMPVRSISLPTRPHPTSMEIEATITKLKSTWESTSPDSTTNPLAAETIQLGLARLAELFNCIEDLIHSPLTQQSFHRRHATQAVEEALEGSVELLDVCNIARDVFLKVREQVQDLQSALRRRGGKDSSIESNIQAYTNFRKKSKKDIIAKSLRTLKRMESSNVHNFGHPFVVEVMRETRAIAVSTFRSLVLFLSAPVVKKSNNISGWSLISRMLRSRGHSRIINELVSVDMALCSMQERIRKGDAKFDVQDVRRRLETLDGTMEGFEIKLDCIFRCLVKNRASLLNLVTP